MPAACWKIYAEIEKKNTEDQKKKSAKEFTHVEDSL